MNHLFFFMKGCDALDLSLAYGYMSQETLLLITSEAGDLDLFLEFSWSFDESAMFVSYLLSLHE
jgi:hypothetical protein